jgi:hypothetical protein
MNLTKVTKPDSRTYTKVVLSGACLHIGGGGRKIESSRSAQEKLVRSYLKNKTQNKGLGMCPKR